MDMRRDPNSAKEALIKALRLTFVPKRAAEKPGKKNAPAPKLVNQPGTLP
jgi:hypothetical protein